MNNQSKVRVSVRYNGDILSVLQGTTVADLVRQQGLAHPDNSIIRIGGCQPRGERLISDGDEITVTPSSIYTDPGGKLFLCGYCGQGTKTATGQLRCPDCGKG